MNYEVKINIFIIRHVYLFVDRAYFIGNVPGMVPVLLFEFLRRSNLAERIEPV